MQQLYVLYARDLITRLDDLQAALAAREALDPLEKVFVLSAQRAKIRLNYALRRACEINYRSDVIQ